MNLDTIVNELRNEHARLSNAIDALTGDAPKPARRKAARSSVAPNRSRDTGKRKGGLTPEGRRKLSLAMKKRWAARRKAAGTKAK